MSSAVDPLNIETLYLCQNKFGVFEMLKHMNTSSEIQSLYTNLQGQVNKPYFEKVQKIILMALPNKLMFIPISQFFATKQSNGYWLSIINNCVQREQISSIDHQFISNFTKCIGFEKLFECMAWYSDQQI